MLMWFDALNERARLKISFLALFVSSTAGFVGLAMFQTVFGGYVFPWWLIAGLFLWLLVMMPAIFRMARLHGRVVDQEKRVSPGGNTEFGAYHPAGQHGVVAWAVCESPVVL